MDLTATCPLAEQLAERLRHARAELTARWLERISARVSIHPNRVFPTDDLLNHVPLLIDGIADYVEDPADPVSGHDLVIAKAMELGAMRFEQGFSESAILKEFELLGGIIYSFLARTADEVQGECTRGELFVCAQRVFHAVALVQQVAAIEFLQRVTARLGEREEQLRAFNRTLTHEFRNRLGAALGAGLMLEEMPELDEDERRRLAGVVARNTQSMREVLDRLLELSRLSTESRQQRNVHLPQAAAEAVRQLRDAAEAQGVTLRVSADLPDVEVNAAAVELALGNLLSNAIKYSDPRKADRWVDVRGRVQLDDVGKPFEAVVEVVDNGIGVAENDRDRLFERFFRAGETTVSATDGSGLGLSIVKDVAEKLGGRAWAEFPESGLTVFAFSLPCRRADDAEAGGTVSQ